MVTPLKTAQQFVKDHQEWFEPYRNHEATWEERPKGKKYNLENANLEGADLTNANLIDANLHGANLRDANLAHAILKKANLSNADLQGANLRFAYLAYANLINATLTDADFESADLFFAKIDSKWKYYIKSQNIYNFVFIEWVEPQDKSKLDQYMNLVGNLKEHGFSNSDILKIIDSFEKS